MYGVWEEDEPMCDQYITSRLIELFPETLGTPHLLETPPALGSAAQLFPFSACSFPDEEIGGAQCLAQGQQLAKNVKPGPESHCSISLSIQLG